MPETPPEILRVVPDTFEVREPFDGPVRIGFSRRISERPVSGSLRDAVVVSPRTGSVSVELSGSDIEIEMEGGFREETIYRITLLPVLQDRFRNRFVRPRDFFFSTGPAFDPTLVAGLLLDRVTGEFVDGARIDARPEGGGPVHSTVSDSTGVFSFRYLPPDSYRVTAYLDQTRNREPDFIEPQDALSVDVQTADTVFLPEMALLAPDTTAARITGARARDSMTVVLETDDLLDTDRPFDDIEVILETDDGVAVPGVAAVLHLWEWEEFEEERRAREAEPDADAVDDPDDPDDPDPPPPDPDPEVDPVDEGDLMAGLLDSLPFRLPETEFIVVLDGPLTPEAEYRIRIARLENLHGIPGGSGEATFVAPEAPPEENPDDDDPPDGNGDPDGDPDGPLEGRSQPDGPQEG